ncbi:PREDICTED: snRNA-activating protein complex subunit 5-like [Branchiostoma belcheri]|uniref:snRNA-activating protein complex subunit 5-like n=1 Tax=Branchiostoma belcheri TaxID=7741 RepID=A0A6P4YZT7_BRABE|nr:PREDICTED: snRNA-activating protein complex subunit 5-like [Branchiostoma belcheri]
MFSELQELEEEERVLQSIQTTLQDQLNRLKVEELALKSMIAEKQGAGQSFEERRSQELKKLLSVNEMEEEDFEDPNINETPLQLDLSQGALLQQPTKEEEFEEEEEEEEDEEDLYEDGINRDLMLLMDQVCKNPEEMEEDDSS